MPLILAHPYIRQSIANKTIVNELVETYPTLKCEIFFQLYPDYKIDVRVLNKKPYYATTRLFCNIQMFWFNMPAILKLWFDEVFTYQFAYGSQGDKLKDKKSLLV
ncbi:NAD(P)H-dependent oxidoreductase [Acinetobacter baumannii]